jgi:hypothetical protein
VSSCSPPLQSYNGLDRDGVTARHTIHCSDVGCKKRQAKAIKLSLPDSAQMSAEAVEDVMALMRQTREEVLRSRHQRSRKPSAADKSGRGRAGESEAPLGLFRTSKQGGGGRRGMAGQWGWQASASTAGSHSAAGVASLAAAHSRAGMAGGAATQAVRPPGGQHMDSMDSIDAILRAAHNIDAA